MTFYGLTPYEEAASGIKPPKASGILELGNRTGRWHLQPDGVRTISVSNQFADAGGF